MIWLVTLMLSLGSNALAHESAVLKVTNDARHKELLLDFGPFHLMPSAPQRHGDHAAHAMTMEPHVQTIRFPVSGWVQGYEVELLDRNGKLLPRRLLHHVNFILPERRELFANIMQRLGAASEETGTVKIPHWLGVHVPADTQLLVSLMLHNPTREHFPEVFLHVRMRYWSEDAWFDPISVQPFYLDVMPLSGAHIYDLPPGRSERSWETRPAISGRILGISGHLHKYAVELRIDDVTEGNTLWRTQPVLDEKKNVETMPKDIFLLGKRIEADHVYRVTAVYDNPTGRAIPDGAMGAIGGVFLPEGGKPWPKLDKTDEEFRRDVRIFAKGALSGTSP